MNFSSITLLNTASIKVLVPILLRLVKQMLKLIVGSLVCVIKVCRV